MEPKWNVKNSTEKVLKKVASVLMEPKWNVKDELSQNPGIVDWRINGTKVECKDILSLWAMPDSFVLMEPKWNVKIYEVKKEQFECEY